MSTGIWAAASGMVGQTAALDVAAGNVANASTPGFRADRAIFRQTLAQATNRAVPTQSLRYSVARTVEPDRRAGQTVQTGRPLDLALRQNDTWFVVRTPEGERYTRAGNFLVSPDGRLTTQNGHLVLGAGRQPLNVPSGTREVSIDPTGSLVADGIDSGSKLLVVSFAKPTGLVKEGSVLLRATPAAGRPVERDPDIASGCLELSNASALEGMTTLVTATREFEMLSRVVEAFSSAEQRAASIAGPR
ncbi:MAG TPA: flagellar hook-basal body protein [Polyangiaceae bacterium]